MTPSELSRAIRLHMRTKVPLMIWGPPGVGKSHTVHRCASDEGMQMVDLRLAYMDVIDARGLMVPDMDKGKTRWLVPDWFPTEGRGVIFLDELPAAPPAVQVVAYQLTDPISRRIGEHILPDGWCVVAAGNRAGDRAISHRMSSALARRFTHVTLEPSFDDWRAWAASENVVPEIIAFLMCVPKHFHDFDPKTWQENAPFGCSATWATLSRIIQAEPEIFGLGKSADNKENAPSWQLELVQGTVGPAAGLQFFLWLKTYLEVPTVDAVLSSPLKTPVPDKPGGLYAISTALAYAAKQKTMAPIVEYMGRLPMEFNILWGKMVSSRDAKALNCEAYQKWLRKYADELGIK